MSDSPIKFRSSPSSSKDDLLAHQSSEKDVSSDNWRSSDYSPSWSSEKEDPEEEDKDEDDADAYAKDDDSNSDFNSNFALPPPKRVRRA
jgi:hypothetical protein